MCIRKVQHSARGIGKTYKSQCPNPEYKDGLCQKHYTKQQEKALNWIERKQYRAATEKDISTIRQLKLKNTNQNRLFRCKNGKIEEYSSKENQYIPTEMPVDYTLFCVTI